MADNIDRGLIHTASKVKTVAIVGGGFAGSLLALKLAKVGHVRPVLIEKGRIAGPGLAYGAADAFHLLNVPVHRMEVGLTSSFADWLAGFTAQTAEAIAEAGDLAQAFVPRRLFGQYLAEQVAEAVLSGTVRRICAEVTRVRPLRGQGYDLTFHDGRNLYADQLVLATGNLAPKAPYVAGEGGRLLEDSQQFVVDPWAPDALTGLDGEAAVLLIGTGLTMADIALSLKARGYRGAIFTLSRRGLMPLPHRAGSHWTTSLSADDRLSPLAWLRHVRKEAKHAHDVGVPWQRVLDAVRPLVAQIWARWTRPQRSQFLRHLRPFWDVHRHRLAPRIARALQEMRDSGQLMPLSGRLKRFAQRGHCLNIAYAVRNRREVRHIKVARVINCTGPRNDFATLGIPLFADLRAQDLIQADALGLGLETQDARIIDRHGHVSNDVFAVGALTRPAWWEVTAVPEITVQIDRLVDLLGAEDGKGGDGFPAKALAHAFFDLGAGI